MTLKILGVAVLLISASHWLIETTGFNEPAPIYMMGPR